MLIVNLWKLVFVVLFPEELCRFVYLIATHEITIISGKYLGEIDECESFDELCICIYNSAFIVTDKLFTAKFN